MQKDERLLNAKQATQNKQQTTNNEQQISKKIKIKNV